MVPGGCLAAAGLIDEYLGPKSHTLPQTSQQIQLFSVVPAVPGRWAYVCSSLRSSSEEKEEVQRESTLSLELFLLLHRVSCAN